VLYLFLLHLCTLLRCVIMFCLFVDWIRMWHSENRRPELVLKQITKIFMFDGLLGCDPLSWIISQQFVKQIDQLFRCMREQLLKTDTFLLWEIELVLAHVSGSTLEQIYQWLLGSTQYFVYFMDLIELSFTIEQRIFGYHLEQHTPIAPNVHFRVIVPISHKTFRCPVPPCGDILRVGLFWKDAYIFRMLPLHDPKSASLMLSPEISTFSGFISLWKMPLLCIYSIDLSSSNI